jgi:hypothetical protein
VVADLERFVFEDENARDKVLDDVARGERHTQRERASDRCERRQDRVDASDRCRDRHRTEQRDRTRNGRPETDDRRRELTRIECPFDHPNEHRLADPVEHQEGNDEREDSDTEREHEIAVLCKEFTNAGGDSLQYY